MHVYLSWNATMQWQQCHIEGAAFLFAFTIEFNMSHLSDVSSTSSLSGQMLQSMRHKHMLREDVNCIAMSEIIH